MIEMHVIKIKIRFKVEPDGDAFHAYCPELKGVHSAGDTEEEALEHAKFAAKEWLEMSIRHNDSIPLCAVESDYTTSFPKFIKNKFFPKKIQSYLAELTLDPC